MNSFLFFYKDASFTFTGKDVYAAKQHAAALLNISPKALKLARP